MHLAGRSHPAVRRLRDARDGRDVRSLFIEGHRLIQDFLATSLVPKEFLYTPAVAQNDLGASVLAALRERKIPEVAVAPDTLDWVSDLSSAPGILLRAERPAPVPWDGPTKGTLLVLDRLSSPINAGALLRVAEAAGVVTVLTTPGTVDLYSAKSLRGSAGSAFRLKIDAGVPLPDFLTKAAASGWTLAAAHPRGEIDFWSFDWKRPIALLVGSEAHGLGDLPPSVQRLRVPMAGRVESLNVAVATAALLMESARQHRPPKDAGIGVVPTAKKR